MLESRTCAGEFRPYCVCAESPHCRCEIFGTARPLSPDLVPVKDHRHSRWFNQFELRINPNNRNSDFFRQVITEFRQSLDSNRLQAPAPTNFIEVSLGTLINDYRTNVVRANSLYLGKNLRVTGRVLEIGIDNESNQYYVYINDGRWGTTPIRVFFSSRHHDFVIQLQPLNYITAVGICEGLLNGIVTIRVP